MNVEGSLKIMRSGMKSWSPSIIKFATKVRGGHDRLDHGRATSSVELLQGSSQHDP
jgi:hypothetical protein